MPIERQAWQPASSFETMNTRLRRTVEVFDKSDRIAVQRHDTSRALDLSFPLTLVVIDTTSGNVTLAIPSPASAVGHTLYAKKVAAANTATLSGAIDGGASLAWTTLNQSMTLVSDGLDWWVV